LHQVDKLTSKKYAKTINLLCAGDKVFVKYQAQGGLTPTPPLRTPLTVTTRMIIWFLVLGHVPASKALHVLIE